MGEVEFVSLAALVREGDGCGARAARAVDLACAGGGYGKEIAASAAVGVADGESLVNDGHCDYLLKCVHRVTCRCGERHRM